jgi:hypothetical protein
VIRSGRLAIFLRRILNPVQTGVETPPVRPPKQPEPRLARIRIRLVPIAHWPRHTEETSLHLANARTTALD